MTQRQRRTPAQTDVAKTADTGPADQATTPHEAGAPASSQADDAADTPAAVPTPAADEIPPAPGDDDSGADGATDEADGDTTGDEADLVTILVLTGVSGLDFNWKPGDEVQLPASEAAKWADGIRARLAD